MSLAPWAGPTGVIRRACNEWLARLFPLLQRELRLAPRKWVTYAGRMVPVTLAAAPVGICLYFAGVSGLGLQPISGVVAEAQAMFLLLWVGIAGLLLATDAISGERRDGTLGLLYLTRLTAFDVVLAKLASCSFRAWQGLLATIPALALPILLGGMTLADSGRLAILLANALFVCLSITLLASTWSEQETAALGWATLILVALFALPPLAQSLGWSSPLLAAWRYVNPATGLNWWQGAGYLADPGRFWTQAVAVHLFGWLTLLATAWRLSRIWRDRPARGLGRWWERAVGKGGWSQWVLGWAPERSWYRRRVVGLDPMAWYASRMRRTWRWPWLAVGFGILAGLSTMAVWPGAEGTVVLVLTSWVVHFVLKQWAGTMACRVFLTGASNRAAELLMSAPLSDRALALGPCRVIVGRFAGPALLAAIVELGLAWHLRTDDALSGHQAGWLVLVLLQVMAFALDLVAVTVVGLWQGAVARNESYAVSGINWWVMILPWLLTLIYLALNVTVLAGAGPIALVRFMFASSIVIDLVAVGWVGRRLTRRLRAVVLERAAGGRPGLASWVTAGRILRRMVGRSGGTPEGPAGARTSCS